MKEPARLFDHRLLGTWRSDKVRTLEEWVYASSTTPEQQERIASSFGKLVVRYTPARVFTEFEGDSTRCNYRVAAIDPDSVAIVCRTEGIDEIRHIHFDGESRYWVTAGRNREFFAREQPSVLQNVKSRPSSTECGLTGRSTGALTAGHLAREVLLAYPAPRGQGVHPSSPG
jgi:hypothetical protein